MLTEKVTVELLFAVCDELPTAVRTGGAGEEEEKPFKAYSYRCPGLPQVCVCVYVYVCVYVCVYGMYHIACIYLFQLPW